MEINSLNKNVTLFWFRRDLRINDNTALIQAAKSEYPIQPIFIFDKTILSELPENDARVSFIYERLEQLNKQLEAFGSSLLIIHDFVENAWLNLLKNFNVKEVYVNRDYEPYAIKRDSSVESMLKMKNIAWNSFKDHVIFEPHEILKEDGSPYSVYTPYSKKWLEKFQVPNIPSTSDFRFNKSNFDLPNLEMIGFQKSHQKVTPYNIDGLSNYQNVRDFPELDGTSHLSVHLRFGTVSIRQIASKAFFESDTYLKELIWREFFQQVLYHHPRVVTQSFRTQYDKIPWRNDEEDFNRWCEGKTGYPIIDAGMRQLNQTGYMHNRVRMIVASFLCKHLLIDWRWGEAYFAEKLLDFELGSNNGNWQWAAGTGCDAAPYFRVFNPETQTKKFDPNLSYIRRWVTDLEELNYPSPIVEHKFARERAINTYKHALNGNE